MVPVESHLSCICKAPVTVCEHYQRHLSCYYWAATHVTLFQRKRAVQIFLKHFFLISSISVAALAAAGEHKHGSGLHLINILCANKYLEIHFYIFCV